MSPRYSTIWNEQIQYGYWLVFDELGGMRFSRGEPDLKRGERAMACTTLLPRSIFKTPKLTASISIDDPNAGAINIDVTAAADALKAVVGVDIDLRVQDAS